MSCASLLISMLGLAGSAVAVSCVLAREHARTAARYRSACEAARAGLATHCPQANRVAEWIHAAGEDRSVATLTELVASLETRPSGNAKSWLKPTDLSRLGPSAAHYERRALRQRGHLHMSLAQNLALIASGITVAVGLLMMDNGPNTLVAEQTVQDEVIALQGADASHATTVAPSSPDTVQPVETAVVAALQLLPMPMPMPMPSLAAVAPR